MSGFDIIKPVKNHSEEVCCTECWQRGISWGSVGERERIIKLLEESQTTTAVINNPITLEPREIKVHSKSVRADLLIALIKGENK